LKSKREQVTGEWREFHNEKLCNLYCSADIIRRMKSRNMRWLKCVTCMREVRNEHKILAGKTEGKRIPANLHVDSMIILKWNLWK
jgi:hypothetical protein